MTFCTLRVFIRSSAKESIMANNPINSKTGNAKVTPVGPTTGTRYGTNGNAQTKGTNSNTENRLK